MRNYANSRHIQFCLLLSAILHALAFVYLAIQKPLKKPEFLPISVDFLSPPRLESMKAERAAPKEKIRKGKAEQEAKKIVPAPTETPPPPVEIPLPMPEPVQPVPSDEAKTVKESSPVLEELKAPTLPGLKELTPSLDQLAKKEAETGEPAREEETVSLDSTDIKYTSYLHGVKLKIEGVWRYPEAARKSALEGRGLVSFTVERDGTLSDLRLLTSSGYPVLDEEILRAIRAAGPFNPMTENMKVKRLNVVASFEYNLIVQRIWGR